MDARKCVDVSCRTGAFLATIANWNRKSKERKGKEGEVGEERSEDRDHYRSLAPTHRGNPKTQLWYLSFSSPLVARSVHAFSESECGACVAYNPTDEE